MHIIFFIITSLAKKKKKTPNERIISKALERKKWLHVTLNSEQMYCRVFGPAPIRKRDTTRLHFWTNESRRSPVHRPMRQKTGSVSVLFSDMLTYPVGTAALVWFVAMAELYIKCKMG